MNVRARKQMLTNPERKGVEDKARETKLDRSRQAEIPQSKGQKEETALVRGRLWLSLLWEALGAHGRGRGQQAGPGQMYRELWLARLSGSASQDPGSPQPSAEVSLATRTLLLLGCWGPRRLRLETDFQPLGVLGMALPAKALAR